VTRPYKLHQSAARGLLARCAVLTLSDTRTPQTDQSGQRIRSLLQPAGHYVNDYRIVREDPAQIAAALDEVLGRADVDVLLLSGGTGISPRDNTVPIVRQRLDRVLSGFGELFRMLSWQEIGSGAMLSDAIAGRANGKLIFAMPGSPSAVELAMTRLILPELPHLLAQLQNPPSNPAPSGP